MGGGFGAGCYQVQGYIFFPLLTWWLSTHEAESKHSFIVFFLHYYFCSAPGVLATTPFVPLKIYLMTLSDGREDHGQDRIPHGASLPASDTLGRN